MHDCGTTFLVQILTDEHRGPPAAEADAEDAAAESVHDAGTRGAAAARPTPLSVPDQRRLLASRLLPHLRWAL